MPGIAGIINPAWSDRHQAALDQMLGRLSRESFDRSGSCVQPPAGLGVGWVSHHESFSESNPVWNAARDIGLVFSGENFVSQREIASLPPDGQARETSRPDYLLRMYETFGVEFLDKLNGCLGGVIFDLREKKVILFNDRYGLKRIYYHQDDTGFYFASEAKSLLKVLPQLRRLDAKGLGEFFSCGCVLQNRTVFPGVLTLPPAACWTFRPDGSCVKDSYFNPATWENQPALTAVEYHDRLAETLRRVLPLYFAGTQPVGLSITGGIDSRLILALAEGSTRNLPCYTFAGPYRECADVRLGRRLATACGLRHQTITVDETFFRDFPALAERTVFLSDGAMDVSGAVELYVNRQAREIAPVRLTGNYGSEILRSNVAFRPGRRDESLFGHGFAQHLREAEAVYAQESQGRRLSFIAFKQVSWHHYARSAIEQSQLTARSPYLDNDLVKLAYQAPAELASSSEHLLALIGEGNPSLARISTDRALRQDSIPGLSGFLRFYQEFSAKAEYAYDYGMPQWLARVDRVLSPLHPERLFLGRHKFYHFRIWYRGILAKYVREILLDRRSLQRAYLNGPRLAEMVGAHTAGRGNFTLEIHKALTVELLQRQLIEQN